MRKCLVAQYHPLIVEVNVEMFKVPGSSMQRI